MLLGIAVAMAVPDGAPGRSGTGPTARPAQAAPGTDFGGGAVSPRFTRRIDYGNRIVSLRVRPDGTVYAFASSFMSCAGRRPAVLDGVVARARPNQDDAFLARNSRTYRSGGGERRTVSVIVAGQLRDTQASGDIRLRLTVRPRGRRAYRCDSRRRPWQARAVPAPPEGATPPAPGSSYYGFTTQRGGVVPNSFLLRVSPDGTRVEQGLFEVHRPCGRPRYFVNSSPPAPVAPDGSFASSERFSLRDGRTVERVTVRMRGQFAQGGAVGTFRVLTQVRRRGRIVARCSTPAVGWRAAL